MKKQLLTALSLAVLLCSCQPQIQYNYIGKKLEYPEQKENKSLDDAAEFLRSIEFKQGTQTFDPIVITGEYAFKSFRNFCIALSVLSYEQKDFNVSAVTEDFEDCRILLDIDMSQMYGIESFEEACFAGNNLIRSIKLPQTVTQIKDNSFYSSEIESIDIGNNVTLIGDYAFSCIGIKQIVLPETLKEIGVDAFYLNTDLKKVVFNCSTIDLLEDGCFSGCYGITEFTCNTSDKKVGLIQIGEENPFNGVKAKLPLRDEVVKYTEDRTDFLSGNVESKFYYSTKDPNALLEDYKIVTEEGSEYSATILVSYILDDEVTADFKLTPGKDFDIIYRKCFTEEETVEGIMDDQSANWGYSTKFSKAITRHDDYAGREKDFVMFCDTGFMYCFVLEESND